MKKEITKNKGGKTPTSIKKPKVTAKYTIDAGNAWTEGDTYTSMVRMLEEVEFDSDDHLEFEVEYSDEFSPRTVGFNYHLESEHCCGLGEIGELSTDVAKLAPMNRMFKKLFEDFKEKTFFVTTITAQDAWEEYLEKSSLFNKVKSFNNPNTNNTVTLWISTN